MPPPTPVELGKAILKYYAPSIAYPAARGNTSTTGASTSSLVSIHPLFELILSCVRRVDPQTRLYVFGSTRVYGFNEASAPTADAQPSRAPVMAATKPVKNDVDIAALSAADVAAQPAAPHPSGGPSEAMVDKGNELTKSLQVDFLEKLKTQLRAQSQQQQQQGDGHGSGGGGHGPPSKLAWEMEVVKRARVPVLRIQPQPLYSTAEPTAGAAAFSTYNADVTYGRRCGVLNSALLRRYIDQQPHLRYLCLVVKRWSKLTGLNTATSPDGSGLTSYGFHLLIVYYALRRQLVQYVPPKRILLEDIEPVPAPLPLCFPASAAFTAAAAAATAESSLSLESLIEKDEQAAALVGGWALDFTRFYLHEFDYQHEVVCISRGAERFSPSTEHTSSGAGAVAAAHPLYVTKEMLQWTKQEEYMARSRGEYLFYRFCIEDPYEMNLNVGRHMSSVKLMIFKKHLEKALETGLSFFPAEEKENKKGGVKSKEKK